MSLESMVQDLVSLLKTMFPVREDAPSILLIGHSMVRCLLVPDTRTRLTLAQGGAVATAACPLVQRDVADVAGLTIIDVVEGAREPVTTLYRKADLRVRRLGSRSAARNDFAHCSAAKGLRLGRNGDRMAVRALPTSTTFVLTASLQREEQDAQQPCLGANLGPSPPPRSIPRPLLVTQLRLARRPRSDGAVLGRLVHGALDQVFGVQDSEAPHPRRGRSPGCSPHDWTDAG